MKIKNVQLLQVCFIVGILITATVATVTVVANTSKNDTSSVISFDVACTIAKNKIESFIEDDFFVDSVEHIYDDNEYLLAYVFHLRPVGYVVVSAHTFLPAVLAFSNTGEFHGYEEILLEVIQADLSSRLTHVSEMSEEYIDSNLEIWNSYLSGEPQFYAEQYFQQWPEQGSTRSGGWLDTKWHQNAPFNNMVPIDQSSGARSVAGCPAVTMAQICNYHETINGVVFDDSDDYYHSYAGNNFWIDDDHVLYDFPSFSELNMYLDGLAEHYQQGVDLSDDDKAALIFACGTAATQVYHPQGSGTMGVDQAYAAYQRFSFEDVDLLDDSDPDVYDRVQDNIQQGLPVHLAVVNEEWNSGHNLVIDGYNTDGYYHLNFGWGGSYDGWYKIPEELPFSLTVLEGVIVDINDNNAISNLDSLGNLYWPDIRPGTTITGSIQIQNTGESGSSIDWEIDSWPDWGSWVFTPDSGIDLTPENGPVTIAVSLEVPDEKNTVFKGEIRIHNINNSSDYCLVHVLLSTPVRYSFHQILQDFLQNHPNMFPLIQRILGLC